MTNTGTEIKFEHNSSVSRIVDEFNRYTNLGESVFTIINGIVVSNDTEDVLEDVLKAKYGITDEMINKLRQLPEDEYKKQVNKILISSDIVYNYQLRNTNKVISPEYQEDFLNTFTLNYDNCFYKNILTYMAIVSTFIITGKYTELSDKINTLLINLDDHQRNELNIAIELLTRYGIKVKVLERIMFIEKTPIPEMSIEEFIKEKTKFEKNAGDFKALRKEISRGPRI